MASLSVRVARMGQTIRCTSYPAEMYGRLLREAGLEIEHQQLSVFHPDFPGMGAEEHLFIHARKPAGPAAPAHALAGPCPLPAAYRGPHELSEQGWLGMEARFERQDVALVVDALATNTRVLDVGGGTGAVVKEIAARLGSVTTVEPHFAREESMRPLAASGVQVLPGRAEQLPFTDGRFDAVVATWVLHFTDAPGAAVAEMARMVDRTHRDAKVVLVQGAPDNELIDLWNRTCAPLLGEPLDHQGYLLSLAARVLAERGFDDIAFTRARVDVVFSEEGPEAKAQAAANVLAAFWNTGHPRLDRLREALLPHVREWMPGGHRGFWPRGGTRTQPGTSSTTARGTWYPAPGPSGAVSSTPRGRRLSCCSLGNSGSPSPPSPRGAPWGAARGGPSDA